MYTSKFGAVFVEKEETGEYYCHDVILAGIDDESNNFEIETGVFTGLGHEIFNLVSTSPDEFFNVPASIDFYDYDEEKDIVILFDNEYIEEVTNYFNFEEESDTFAFLANELNEICIHRNNDGTFFTKKCESKKTYTRDDINEHFYEESEKNPKVIFNGNYNPIEEMFREILGPNISDENGQSFSVGPIIFGIKTPEPSISDEMIKEMKKEIEKTKPESDLDKINTESINTKKVIEDTSKKIVGQERVIKTLVNQIYNNQRIIDDISKDGDLDITELDARKTSILLDGETGTGKTAILKDIAKQLGLPIVIASSTNFSGTGYIGASVTDLLEDLLSQTNGNLEKAERGIIVFDEIDKIAFQKNNVIGVDMNEEVQHELLSFVGGGEYEVPIKTFPFGRTIKFNTSKNTFILSGAFTDLREEKIKETDKSHNQMGFSAIASNNYDREYMVTPEDYIKYGLMREFFGRIKVLTSTKSYNLDDCKRILQESTISPLLNFEKTVKMYGYPGIEYNEEFLDKVAKYGLEMKTGARGLQTVMSGIQDNLLDALINGEFDKTKPITLTTKMLDDYKKSFIRKY